jgi:hypothetical protein
MTWLRLRYRFWWMLDCLVSCPLLMDHYWDRRYDGWYWRLYVWLGGMCYWLEDAMMREREIQ